MLNVITVRQATLLDAQALFEAHQDAVQRLCAGAYTSAQLAVWFEDRSPEMYRPAIEAQQMFLAESGSRVAGFVGFVPGEVTVLFVRPEAAGQGLGKRLLELGLAQAAIGFTGPLTVVSTLNAQDFYRKQGFEVVGADRLVRGQTRMPIEVVKMSGPLAAAFHPPTATV